MLIQNIQMPGRLHDLRSELRNLRKEAIKPISRMKLGDVSSEIERLRGMREETPAAAATPSAPHRNNEPAAESIKQAKESEFPVRPATKKEVAPKSVGVKKGGKNIVAAAKEKADAAPLKMKAKLAKLLSMMDDDE
jgi:hypothetical protein